MKVTNPDQERSILAYIVDQTSGEGQWHEVPPGETKDVEDYVVASTLVEHGATAAKADLEAARELWAEENRRINSRTASASASEGEIVQRRQATVDVATGTTTGTVEDLKGDALKAAVAEANANGAEIDAKAKVDAQREQLAAWQKARGSSTPVDEEFVVDESGSVVLDDEGQPVPVDRSQVDAAGAETTGDEPAGDHSGQDEDTAEGQE